MLGGSKGYLCGIPTSRRKNPPSYTVSGGPWITASSCEGDRGGRFGVRVREQASGRTESERRCSPRGFCSRPLATRSRPEGALARACAAPSACASEPGVRDRSRRLRRIPPSSSTRPFVRRRRRRGPSPPRERLSLAVGVRREETLENFRTVGKLSSKQKARLAYPEPLFREEKRLGGGKTEGGERTFKSLSRTSSEFCAHLLLRQPR